jgi:hypothetical protein
MYMLVSLSGTLLGLIALRAVVAAAVWIVTGHALWLLPDLLNDEVWCC